MQALDITIPGTAVPQGSMRLVNGGRRMIHSNRELPAWRAAVASHTIAAIVRAERQTEHRYPFTGPVRLIVVFHLPRPKGHYRQGKYAGLLRPSAPRSMQVGPDLDKLVRAVGDGVVSACAIVDDKQICQIHAHKVWTSEEPTTYVRLIGVRP